MQASLPLKRQFIRMKNILYNHIIDLIMRFRLSIPLVCSCLIGAFIVASCTGDSDSDTKIDREYVLNAKMIGYTGIGGDIDGDRNPVLRDRKSKRLNSSH